MIKNHCIPVEKGKRLFRIPVAAGMFGGLLALAPLNALQASPTVGTGLLLFNYSNLTAYVAETSNPAPYCVNNQGAIPQPMTVAPGNINNPNADNQDIEFTAQDMISSSCDLLAHNDLNSSWQYPFNLYFSDGQPGIIYTFATDPSVNDVNQCAGWSVGNLVGIYGMTCVYEQVTTGGIAFPVDWFYYENNTVMVTLPYVGANYYYTMTSLAGPSGENVPSGVPPTITGSGNACSAPNWNSCAWIQVYNVGEGPYPSGAVGSAANLSARNAASMAEAPRTPAAEFALPVVVSPNVKKVNYAFNAENGQIVLRVKAGGVTRRLIRAYSPYRLGNRLDASVMVNGDNVAANANGSAQLKVNQGSGMAKVPLTFSPQDISAIRQAIKMGNALKIQIQLKQHVRTPKETFEVAKVTSTKYNPHRAN